MNINLWNRNETTQVLTSVLESLDQKVLPTTFSAVGMR